MKPEELRIGNWYVHPEGYEAQWEFSHNDWGWFSYDEFNSLKGVPLTEEWLLKMNFKKIEESPFENIILPYWVNNSICCFYNETDKDNFLLGHAYTDFNGKYHVATAYWTNEVHTLQNYYKANTRKELEVK